MAFEKEIGHEKVAIADLQVHCYKPEDIIELPETRAVYHSQAFFCRLLRPIRAAWILDVARGYGCESCPKVTKRLMELYGEKACRFLRLHAEEDPGHVDAGLKYLDGLNDRQNPRDSKESQRRAPRLRQLVGRCTACCPSRCLAQPRVAAVRAGVSEASF